MNYSQKLKARAYLKMEECSYCGVDYNLTIDHKKPKIKGGTDDFANLQVLCQKCNVAKSNLEDHEVRRIFKLRDKIILERGKQLRKLLRNIQKDEADKSISPGSKKVIHRLLDMLAVWRKRTK